MPTKTHIGVDDVARKIKTVFIGVDGVARSIKKIYIGDERGKARLCFNTHNHFFTYSYPYIGTSTHTRVGTCSCGERVEETVSHSFSTLNGYIPPTCSTQESRTYICECGNTKTYYYGLDPNNHEGYNYKYTVNPTCTDGGYDVYKCACGDSYESNYTSALGHHFTELGSVYKEATCTEDAIHYGKCIVCKYESTDANDMLTKANSALGHQTTSIWKWDLNYHWLECSRCDTHEISYGMHDAVYDSMTGGYYCSTCYATVDSSGRATTENT